jgi:hypothetical protein
LFEGKAVISFSFRVFCANVCRDVLLEERMTEAILRMAYTARRSWLEQFEATKDGQALEKAEEWGRLIVSLGGNPESIPHGLDIAANDNPPE